MNVPIKRNLFKIYQDLRNSNKHKELLCSLVIDELKIKDHLSDTKKVGRLIDPYLNSDPNELNQIYQADKDLHNDYFNFAFNLKRYIVKMLYNEDETIFSFKKPDSPATKTYEREGHNRVNVKEQKKLGGSLFKRV